MILRPNQGSLVNFVPGSTALHRLDPRTKLFCLLILLFGTLLADSFAGLILFLVFVVNLFWAARLSLSKTLRGVAAFAPLFVITFAIHLFGHAGKEMFDLPVAGLSATQEGMAAGILFTLRMISLILVLGLFLSLTAPQDLTDGIEMLTRPLARLGLPISQAALMIAIILRSVPILKDEAERIRQAQISRGASLEGMAILKIHRYIPILLPLFAGVLKRADALALALEARGYRGGVERTRMTVLQFGLPDATAIVLTGLFCGGIWALP